MLFNIKSNKIINDKTNNVNYIKLLIMLLLLKLIISLMLN